MVGGYAVQRAAARSCERRLSAVHAVAVRREAPLLSHSVVNAVVLRSRLVGCAGSPFTLQGRVYDALCPGTSGSVGNGCGKAGKSPPVVGTTDTRQGFSGFSMPVVHAVAYHQRKPFMPGRYGAVRLSVVVVGVMGHRASARRGRRWSEGIGGGGGLARRSARGGNDISTVGNLRRGGTGSGVEAFTPVQPPPPLYSLSPSSVGGVATSGS